MKIDRVTITGADDSVYVWDLMALTEKYPFVEWGILFSGTRQGTPRYPSLPWLKELEKEARALPQLCAHLCGRWVRNLVLGGDFTFKREHEGLWPWFKRVQLNFHGDPHKRAHGFEGAIGDEAPKAGSLGVPARVGKEFILQCDGVNDDIVDELAPWLPIVPLFDRSGGAGVVPKEWPKPLPGVYCGYAGGIGPENIVDEIRRIAEVAGNERVWIDMETRVRSNDDHRFDLEKVEECLKLAEPFVREV